MRAGKGCGPAMGRCRAGRSRPSGRTSGLWQGSQSAFGTSTSIVSAQSPRTRFASGFAEAFCRGYGAGEPGLSPGSALAVDLLLDRRSLPPSRRGHSRFSGWVKMTSPHRRFDGMESPPSSEPLGFRSDISACTGLHFGNKLVTALATSAQHGYKIAGSRLYCRRLEIKQFKSHRNLLPISRRWQRFRTQNPVHRRRAVRSDSMRPVPIPRLPRSA